ncbi:MAG: hypothetical protein GKR87_12765 [Kiritimatiellae bacterium]|nr:hypothetical protein [Kiritimatiellia bacterium]
MKNMYIVVSILSVLMSQLQTSRGDQVISDDLIVEFSLAVGSDAVNGESFGSDTLRLKENNLRIHCDDTSATAGFPANDWRIVINDTGNGGDSYFRIEDSTAGRSPFTIEAGALANALFVESTGDIGINTDNPVVELHVVDGDTSTLRLEQNGSSGFTPQTWDVAGNEANFFIRDVTGGSTLPFRIRSGAPASSIDIQSDGKVGMGTDSPAEALHLERSDGTAKVLVEDTFSTIVSRPLLELKNRGGAQIVLHDSSTAQKMEYRSNGHRYVHYFKKMVRPETN